MTDNNSYINRKEVYLRSILDMRCYPDALVYTIAPGDILNGIASKFQTTVDLILQANPGLDPNWLNIGQQIFIPVPSSEKGVPSMNQIAQKVSPSIVGIKTIAKNSKGQFSIIEGSGIIINKDGYIATNRHLVEDAVQGNKNEDLEIFLPDQRRAKAKFIGSDSLYDLAVVKIDLDNLLAAQLGDSSRIEPGELAIVAGNPRGIEPMGMITTGTINGFRQRIFHESLLTYIQTDVVINQGNSGGALVNHEGQVIGINLWGVPIENGYDNVGLAIPINTAKPIVDRLISSSFVKDKLSMGIKVEAQEQRKKPHIGITIAEVTKKSSAYKAGLRKGDVLISLADKPVSAIKDLDNIKKGYKAGDTVNVVIVRKNKIHDFKLTFSKAVSDSIC